jgi:limonene-1,2-epoxide hydrolase
MSSSEEAVVREFMAAWGDGSQETPDIEKIMSMFAEDAVWRLWIPGGPTLKGRAAIRKDIERQLTFATFMRCGPIHIASNGPVVFTERLDSFVTKGRTIEHYLMAVFEVVDGRITAWREYFDTKDIDRQFKPLAVEVPKAAR